MPPESNSFKPTTEKENNDSAFENFSRALLDSAIQKPVNGLTQLANEVPGVKLPEMHCFDQKAPTDSSQKFAQEAGNVVGMIVPFALSHSAVRYGAAKMDIELSNSMLSRGAEHAATGALMGFALTPTDDGFTGRLKNSIVDAGTFGVMGASSARLMSAFPVAGELPLSSRIVKSSLLGIGSGIPAGFTNAELKAITDRGQFASASEVRDDVASFALLGGIFGAAEGWRGKSEAFRRTDKEITTPTEMEQRFPRYTEAQLQAGRDAVRAELAQVKASAPDAEVQSELGKFEPSTMSVLDKFNQANLSDAQRERILDALAAVRENHVSTRASDGSIDPDQEKNWIHTQGEFGRNIDSAQRMHLTPEQTEDTLIGSMFSDAVKTKANFMVHHRDGREAAVTFLNSLGDKGLSQDRINGIGNMILEHQIGPPGFMRMIYANSISADINIQRSAEMANLKAKGVDLTSEEQAQMASFEKTNRDFEARVQTLASNDLSSDQRAVLNTRQAFGRFVTDEEADAITSLGAKIAKPLDQPVVDTEYGAKAVQLTDLERSLLKRTGNEDWYVPNENTPWYGASKSLINADSIDNYATPGGFSKLVGMNGPETAIFFRDRNIDVTLASPRRSFGFAYEIMSPEGQKLADAELAKTDEAIERARARTNDWLREQLHIPKDEPMPSIPYWNSDLAYPDRGSFEIEWWKLHTNADRTPAQEALYQQQRFTGLTTEQVDQFLFAKRIRDHMVDELRREQRVDGSLPPDFHPVMDRPALTTGH